MKGFKDFVIAEFGRDSWRTIQSKAGLQGKIYVPVTEYPDDELTALVRQASTTTDTEVNELLTAFGVFLVEPLLGTYSVHVDDDWEGLELVANVETYIHTALRAKAVASYTPPELESHWIDDTTVRIVYGSDRRLCALARGLLTGVAKTFDEPFAIEERSCMHQGAQQCEFVVSKRAGHNTGTQHH